MVAAGSGRCVGILGCLTRRAETGSSWSAGWSWEFGEAGVVQDAEQRLGPERPRSEQCVRLIATKPNGSVVWTRSLTGVGVLLGCAAFLAATVLALVGGSRPGNGYMLTWLTLGIGGLAVVAVSLANYASGRSYQKYKDVKFPDLPAAQLAWPGHGTPPRTVVRRICGAEYFVAVSAPVIIFLTTVTSVFNPDHRPNAFIPPVVAFGAFLLCLFAGPIPRFVVTPEYLCIDTAFQSRRIPRRSIEGLSSYRDQLKITLTDGRTVKCRVDSPLVDFRGSESRASRSRLIRTADKIVSAFALVPTSAKVDVRDGLRWRKGSVASAVGIVILVIGVIGVLAAASTN
jgi:hypothetical protein